MHFFRIGIMTGFLLIALCNYSFASEELNPDQNCTKATNSNLEFSKCMAETIENLQKISHLEFEKALAIANEYDDAESIIYGGKKQTTNVESLNQSKASFDQYLKDECYRQSRLFGASSAAGRVKQACEAELLLMYIDSLKKQNN